MKPLRMSIALGLLLLSASAYAKVSLPALFTDGMVLQRNQTVPVWGWADAGEAVTVTLGKKTYTTTATADGTWRIDMPKMKAGGPYQLTVNDITLSDVMVGDVYLCSGQSNIDLMVSRVYPQYVDEIDADVNTNVRLFRVENVPVTDGPQRDVRATGWKTLSKDNAWTFSSLGYFLGKRMQKSTGVPTGIIQTSWGGTPIEAWLPADSMAIYNPKMLAETKLYQDKELVNYMNNMNNRANNRWQQLLDEIDPGVAGKYTSPDCDDSKWTKANQFNLPVPVHGTPSRDFCGSYWLRQHITVDKAHAGKSALLLVGTLYDADYTYVNGKEVGRTYYQYPPRRYNVPEGLLKEGDNVITVRIVNKNGKPSFWHDKPYRIEYSDGTKQPLSEEWLVNDGTQMPRQPGVSLDLHYKASTLWNGMLHGLAPYALSGIVWYQGESNTGRAHEYEAYLGCLMHSWRQVFERPDLPFSIVQLANYMAPSPQPQNSGWAQLREGQHRAALKDSRAELACAIDLGEAVDIHPLLKKDVAERCGLCFDRLVYGKKVLLAPEVTAVKSDAQNVTITFDQPLTEGTIGGFELAASDRKFQNVTAQSDGTSVRLTIPAGMTPAHIRYAYKDNPVEANLRGKKSDLPAVPFEKGI